MERKTRTKSREGSRAVFCLHHEETGFRYAKNGPCWNSCSQITANRTQNTTQLTENCQGFFYRFLEPHAACQPCHGVEQQLSSYTHCLRTPSPEARYYCCLPFGWHRINLFWLCDSSDDYTVFSKEPGHMLLHAWAVTNCATRTRQNLVRGDQLLWRQRRVTQLMAFLWGFCSAQGQNHMTGTLCCRETQIDANKWKKTKRQKEKAARHVGECWRQQSSGSWQRRQWPRFWESVI